MFKCLGWPCPATFIFLLFETPIVTLWSSCAPKHVLWQRVFRSASEFKVRNLIQWTGHFAIYVRWLFGWRYISSLHSADELQQERNSCPLLRSCFIGSCHVGVSKCFSVVSALQSFAQNKTLSHLRIAGFQCNALFQSEIFKTDQNDKSKPFNK